MIKVMEEEIKQTKSRGNVIVENIKVGDIHYEYDMGRGLKCEVITLPILEEGSWSWESKNLTTGAIINYRTADVNSEDYDMCRCYGFKLYDYEAYRVEKYD